LLFTPLSTKILFSPSDIIMAFYEKVLTSAEITRIERVRIDDEGFGYDKFGANRETLFNTYAVIKLFYEKYFRVESFGIENIPLQGRAILASNHSGTLPLDGMMIGIDIFRQLEPPRLMRAVVDRFAAALPYVGTFLSRCGQVTGSRRNFQELLEAEEMVAVFPEGARALGKNYKDRYKLYPFNMGFVELSLTYKAPIIPVAVVGAEEQMPVLADIKPLAKMLGVPYVPILPTILPIPMPTHYHIYYGEPLHYYKQFAEDTVQSPEMVRELARDVQEKVQRMIDQGLAERKGIFV
jgi:1-acyl-sn-glycerol-3-phosphate acyltransferase